MKYISRFCLCPFMVLLLTGTVCIGQQIKLKDVTKIEFLYRIGGMGSDGRLVELVPENNGWKSYQTRLVVSWDFKKKLQIDDSARTFVRDVPQKVLTQLLSLITKPDTATDPGFFHIQKNQLVKYIDTLYPRLKPQQKAEFVKAVQTDSIVHKMLVKENHPIIMDDRNYYGITVTTKTHITYKIYAQSFANSYYLPWIINEAKSFNPRIAEIFEFVGGNDDYLVKEKIHLHKQIDFYTYLTYFQTRFYWDDFKQDEPKMYALMNNTIKPINFWRYEHGESGMFSSSKLPAYVQLDLGFPKQDTAAIKRYKSAEDSLSNIFKEHNFLFDYIKSMPGRMVEISPKEMTAYGERTFKEIRKYYPEIDQFDYKRSYVLTVVEPDGKYWEDRTKSKWLLLPNKTIILLYYTGTIKFSPDVYFERILFTGGSNTACFVFDSSGKKIAGIDGPVNISVL